MLGGDLGQAYDPLAEGSKLRSHELFAELRRSCPVHHHRMPEAELERQNRCFLVANPTSEFWSVLRYDDCIDVLRDKEGFSNKEGPGPERMAPLSPDGMLLIADEPVHRRQRQIVNKAFVPRAVDVRRPLIERTIDDLIDAVASRGHADVVSEISIPLTVAMITDFLGAGQDRSAEIARWGAATMAVLGGDPEAVEAGATALAEMFLFVGEQIAERRNRLSAGLPLPDDVLSAMITAEFEGSVLSDEEICLACAQFLSAGFDTTAIAIGSAIYLLCTHPEERAKLEADWSLLDGAAEECLRYEPPLEGTFRTTKHPVAICGEQIPEGGKVRVVYASANRDEKQFPDADQFRVDRPLAELRRHIAFGHGTHACIGAALARAELTIAVETLLRRLPGLQLDPDREPSRATSLTLNGFDSVPITWDVRNTRPRRSVSVDD